jgi:predicted TPR repeat methyltransferase
MQPEQTPSPSSPSLTPGVVPNRQRRSPLGEALRDILSVPVNFVDEFKYRLNHLPMINYQLGLQMLAEGRLRDAILRFRLALWLAPNHQESWYYLGTSYLSLGQKVKAMQAFARSYKLNPNHEETRFMLATIDPNILPEAKRPTTMPATIAVDYFDRLAPDYDRSQASLGYRAHIVAEASLQRYLEPKRVNHTLIDLGCGTGLTGTMLAPYCEQVIGVDVSRGMLAQASERRREDKSRIYSSAYQQDMRLFLPDVPEPVELITAVHVFNYMGDLGHLFEHAARALRPGGLFLFQVEPYAAAKGFAMLPKVSRFGHSEAYLREKIATTPLEVVTVEAVQAYPDGQLAQYILRKPA